MGYLSDGALGLLRQDHFHFRMRPWDHMHRYQFTNALCGGCTGISSCFDSTDVASNHDGDVSSANIFGSDQVDIRGFYHRVRGFDRADQPFRFYHSQCN